MLKWGGKEINFFEMAFQGRSLVEKAIGDSGRFHSIFFFLRYLATALWKYCSVPTLGRTRLAEQAACISDCFPELLPRRESIRAFQRSPGRSQTVAFEDNIHSRRTIPALLIGMGDDLLHLIAT